MEEFIPPKELRFDAVKQAADMKMLAMAHAYTLGHSFLSAWAEHVVDQWTGEPTSAQEITLSSYEVEGLCRGMNESTNKLLATATSCLNTAWGKKVGDLFGVYSYPNPPILKKEYSGIALYFPAYTPIAIH